MRRAILVYNPKSGRQVSGRLVTPVLAELRGSGFEVVEAPTVGPGDATRLARQAAADGCDVVFAMGGDGTLREAAAGILGTETALGPLPAGTANVLSIAFGLPRNARAAARVLPSCVVQEIDVGLAGEQPFLMMASFGLDAEIMAYQNSGLKRILGAGAVVASGIGRGLRYPYPDISFRSGGVTETATFVVVTNIAFYGGPFRMVPGGDFRDGKLDLVRFRSRGPGPLVSFIFDMLRGARHVGRADVDISPVEEVEIFDPPGDLVQLDGDALSVTPPLVVKLAPWRLRVLLPET